MTHLIPMPVKRPRSPRRKSIELNFQFGDSATAVQVPLDVDPHTLVLAAWGRFLPSDVYPSRLMRGDTQIAFYNPLANFSTADIRSGDVLVCECDLGQFLETPSMLSVYRLIRQYDQSSRSRATEFGHL